MRFPFNLRHNLTSGNTNNRLQGLATMTTARRSARIRNQASLVAQTKKNAEIILPPPIVNTTAAAKRKRKASPTPATPPPKKRTQASLPVTPTPSGIGPIAQQTEKVSKLLFPVSVTRLADPNITNATLLSPETSRIVASRDVHSLSPSKAPKSGTTTQTLLKEASEHLIKVDERMRQLVENNYCHLFSPEGLAEKVDPFESLTSGIISQQVSGAAAKSIKAKFIALFEAEDNRFPHPSEVSACSIEKLRTAGLSQRKAEYIQGLAEKFKAGELSAQMLHGAPYEELVEKLVAVRGLGKWSVEMFACFGLKRMDVFSTGDLGVQRGMAAFEGRDVAKLKSSKGGKWKYMSEKEMLDISSKFAPYRSLFMWLMWRVEETDISTME